MPRKGEKALYVREDLHKRVKQAANLRRTTIRKFVEEILSQRLNELEVPVE